MDVPNRWALKNLRGQLVVVPHGQKRLKLGKILGGGEVNATVQLVEVNSARHVVKRPWEKVRLIPRKVAEEQILPITTSNSWFSRIFRMIFG